MATKKSQKRKGGLRKIGRTKRKALRNGSAESLYSKGLISGEAYFKLKNKTTR